MATGPERRQGRGQEIRQRLGAIRARIEELQVRRQADDADPVSVDERLASARRQAAASQAAATRSLAAVVRALRRSAESHVDAADIRKADRAQLYLQDQEAEDAHEPGSGQLLSGSMPRRNVPGP